MIRRVRHYLYFCMPRVIKPKGLKEVHMHHMIRCAVNRTTIKCVPVGMCRGRQTEKDSERQINKQTNIQVHEQINSQITKSFYRESIYNIFLIHFLSPFHYPLSAVWLKVGQATSFKQFGIHGRNVARILNQRRLRYRSDNISHITFQLDKRTLVETSSVIQ